MVGQRRLGVELKKERIYLIMLDSYFEESYYNNKLKSQEHLVGFEYYAVDKWYICLLV
jgi:hypothetical protein